MIVAEAFELCLKFNVPLLDSLNLVFQCIDLENELVCYLVHAVMKYTILVYLLDENIRIGNEVMLEFKRTNAVRFALSLVR